VDTSSRSNLKTLEKKLSALVAHRDFHATRVKDAEARLPVVEEQLRHHEQARDLLLKIGTLYRKVSVDRINALVTMGLRSVFNRNYQYHLAAEEKRGQVEMSQSVRIGGLELDPQSSMGGGIVDVVSFCLRVVVWSMMKSRTQPVMVLDEPFRCVSSGHVDAAAALLKKISLKMGIQFVVVTHNPALANAADKTFEVLFKDGESTVRAIQ